jgi:hypothetical protein
VGFQLLESPVHFGFCLVDLRPELAGLMASNLPTSLDSDFHGILLEPKRKGSTARSYDGAFSMLWDLAADQVLFPCHGVVMFSIAISTWTILQRPDRSVRVEFCDYVILTLPGEDDLVVSWLEDDEA